MTRAEKIEKAARELLERLRRHSVEGWGPWADNLRAALSLPPDAEPGACACGRVTRVDEGWTHTPDRCASRNASVMFTVKPNPAAAPGTERCPEHGGPWRECAGQRHIGTAASGTGRRGAP